MEELFVGNSVILLFWVYVSFIIEVETEYKKIILMYLITYVTNILNIVPTMQSFGTLLLALFLEIEFLEDRFKKRIINNIFEKIIDFLYIMISQYSLVSFILALILSSNMLQSYCTGYFCVLIQIASGLVFYLGCKNVASEKYKICSFERIKAKIDRTEKYRDFLQKEDCICNPGCVLEIEDRSFFSRGRRYTFLNTFYLRKLYLKKIKDFFDRFLHASDKKASIKKLLRGYSTIEMQLLRTLAIEEGYQDVIRRKIFEIIYARLFWRNLELYYKKCDCDVEQFKEYIFYLYLRLAPCLNKGQEGRLEEVIRPRSQIEDFSQEELFILALCFSGKIKRNYALEIYEDIIQAYGLDRERLNELVYQLNL